MKEEDVIKTEAYQNYETRWEGNDKDRNKLFQRYLTLKLQTNDESLEIRRE